jgi:sRNA-binding carbon storage regulator CsrA
MLVLGARIGERIFVGDASVKFVRFQDGGIRLGFDFPPNVQIEREKARNKRLGTTNTIPAASLPPEYKQKRN